MEFLAPKVEREIGVDGAETSDEVILECLDRSFSRVAEMIGSGCKLEGDLAGIQKVLYCLGGFVIEEVESWALACRLVFLLILRFEELSPWCIWILVFSKTS